MEAALSRKPMTSTTSAVFSRLLLLLALAVPTTLWGQTATGELSITITDPSGAIIKDAEVTITGADTGATVRVLKSNDRGIAEVPVLQPGRYNTHIVMPGFETVDRTGVSVNVGSIISLDITLTLGESNETVTVNGDAPLIDDKSETIAQVINAKELTDLPLNGRNYLEAANYIPGVIPTSSGRDNSFSAYGNTGLQNAFLLDGSRNVNYLRGLDNQQRDMVRPPLDALLQFTIQTSNFSAEFGASAGAVVNAITKSGTKAFHGSAYDFLRNSTLDSTNRFATLGKPLLVRNQFGASLGGPVWREKAFFFGAYEGIHQRSEGNGRVIVPTALERMGDFSKTTTTSATGVVTVTPIFDPSTTVGTGTAATRRQFTGNIIPAARINAIGQMLANLYPLPNLPSAGLNTYTRNAPSRLESKNAIGRVDYQISPKDSVFARYAHAIQNTANEATLLPPASNPGVSTITTKGIGTGYTRVITNSLLDELRFSWTRVIINSGGIAPRNEIIPGSLDPLINTGTPSFGVGIYAGLGGQAPCCASSPLAKSSDVYDIANNVSYSHGKHQIKFGGDFLIIKPKTFSTIGGRSNFGFSGAFTQNPRARGSSGSALADLLLGDANTLTTGTEAQSDERGNAYGIYATDQYQISDSLTLNYGVRYEYSSPFIETQDHLGNFILDPGSPFYGKIVFAGNPAFPRSLIYPDRVVS